MTKHEHPAWHLARLAITGGWITLCLWICASQFDETELKAIGGIMLGLGGAKVMGLIQEKLSGSDR